MILDPTEHYEELTSAVSRGESLPASWYTDSSVTQLEIDRIFRRTWQYVGPLSELQNVGDYITGVAGLVPVVVMRNEDGLAAFINVCRHRRHEVMKDRGCAKMMQCGYHGWTYGLDGALKGAPRTQNEPNFNPADYPLLPARAEALGPWVFVNLDLEARPVEATFGRVLDLIAQSGIDLENLQLWERSTWESGSNWKTMLENFLECYHCAIAHPSFSAAIDVRPESYQLSTFDYILSQIGHVRDTALEGRSAVPIPDLSGGIVQAQYHLLWPNTTISINPGFPNLEIDVWHPNGANSTKGLSEHYFGKGVTRQFAEQMIAFNAEVGVEDDDLTLSVQNGLRSGFPKTGRFLTGAEHLAVDFLHLVVDGLSGREKVAVPDERNTYVDLEIDKVVRESDVISSFYLRRADGKPLEPWEPGMFLPIRVDVPGHAKPLLRTYTISTSPNFNHYRLSVRRDPDGAVSKYLHDECKAGSRIKAMAPRGKFVLDRTSNRPIVFLSAGVGLTPMLAMSEALLEEGVEKGTSRPMYFIHGAKDGKVHAFADALRDAAKKSPSLKLHFRYSAPGAADALGTHYDSSGYVDAALVASMVDPKTCDFYLCGPGPFMQSNFDGIVALGVDEDRIHFESFGSATVHKASMRGTAATNGSVMPIPVRFARSGVELKWTGGLTLLELAESQGLAPEFGCRSGICGSCATRLSEGSVDYLEEPMAQREDGEVLLCCSVPHSSRNPDGEEVGITLEM
jgi:ferredoxin-NADP reductase/phenylpropionate dioxygenase-like ring-hydroxylating dioxygenase large terminal subunit